MDIANIVVSLAGRDKDELFVIIKIEDGYALIADGKLIRLSQPGAPDRYDNTTRHDHLICTRCGALADFKFTDLTHDIEAALGARIQSYDLRIHYLCPACRKAQEAH